MQIPDLRGLYGYIVVGEGVKVVYHGPQRLVKYDHTNARLRIIWTYGVSLKSQVRVQKQ